VGDHRDVAARAMNQPSEVEFLVDVDAIGDAEAVDLRIGGAGRAAATT
jgi:hypothetical protein